MTVPKTMMNVRSHRVPMEARATTSMVAIVVHVIWDIAAPTVRS